MRPFRTLLLLGACLLLAAPPATAHSKSKPDDKDKKEGGDYAAKIKDREKIEGLFTFYYDAKDNSYLMEITPEQLDRTYLCSTTRDAGDGRYYDSGSMQGQFPFRFEKVGKRIRWIHENVYYRADADLPVAAAVERGLTNSVVGATDLVCDPHEKSGALLIDPAELFLQDYPGVAEGLSARDVNYSLDSKNSHFGHIRSFPQNSEIDAVLHYTSKKEQATQMRIPDARSLQHRYRYSLVEIPESDYRPRLADARVGHFLTTFQDYSDVEKDTPYVWYVERWDLRKADPSLAVSPPVKPIVYWIENTVPVEYRAAIREGAELWNRAFERVGFRDALVVKQMPDDADWDPADVRYNVIRWIVQPGGTYAVGPSHANPFTGELYAADIRISSDFVRAYFWSYEQYINPLAAYSDVLDGLDARPDPSRACRYSQGKAFEAGFGMDWMAMQGFIDPDSPEVRQFIHDGIVDLVVHEVGHTLGLRHNFRASTIHDLDQVHDRELTAREGISGSVMDYNPVNVAPRGKPQGSYWCTGLGTYDYWAIEYAYTPIAAASPEGEREALDRIASRSADPLLPYATDEDAMGFGAQGMDPVVNMWDLGPDPLAFYEQRLDLARHILAGIETSFAKPGEEYTRMRSVFSRAMRQYVMAANTVSRYVGGVHQYRDRIGTVNGRLPYEPVPAAKQREALRFLDRRIFTPEVPLPASLLRKLAPERLNDFDWSATYQPRADYPVHDVLLAAQETALRRLYHPITMSRLVDLPMLYEKGADTFTLGEMFDSVRGSIWSEVAGGRNVGSARRNLQRAHLDRLIEIAIAPSGSPVFSPSSEDKPVGRVSVPEDARSFARADLTTISANIKNAMGGGALDRATRAHLAECRARIDAALAAGLERKM